jgi:NAD dependent epimerase/dehydratase family enzyme
MSWIGLHDLLRAVLFVIDAESLSGALNVSTPKPVTNAQFSHTLGEVLHRPAVATVPEFAVKLMFGEMGEETLLSGQRVLPRRLLEAGFTFDFPDLEKALRHELGK